MVRALVLFAFMVLFLPFHAMVRAGVEVDNDDGDRCYYYDCPWNGPGFYFGIWFDNEREYDNWNYYHGYYQGRGYYGGHGGHGGGHGGHR